MRRKMVSSQSAPTQPLEAPLSMPIAQGVVPRAARVLEASMSWSKVSGTWIRAPSRSPGRYHTRPLSAAFTKIPATIVPVLPRATQAGP